MNAFNLVVVYKGSIYQAAHFSKMLQKKFRLNLIFAVVKHFLYSGTYSPGPSYSVEKRIRTDNSEYYPAAIPLEDASFA